MTTLMVKITEINKTNLGGPADGEGTRKLKTVGNEG